MRSDINPFGWLKWAGFAAMLNNGWKPDKLARLKLHTRLKRFFFNRHTLVPCSVCGRMLFFDMATIDHVVPLSKGGDYDAVNLVITCVKCNTERSDGDFWSYRHGIRAAKRRGSRRPAMAFLPGTL
jgi:hypothetical protein